MESMENVGRMNFAYGYPHEKLCFHAAHGGQENLQDLSLELDSNSPGIHAMKTAGQF